MRNAAKRNEFRQLLLSDLDRNDYVRVVRIHGCASSAELVLPTHSKMLFWLFLSVLTHLSRCPQIHSFLFTIKVFHCLHLPHRRSSSAATPRSAKEGLQLRSPEDTFTLEPFHAFPHATLPERNGLLGATYTDINTSFFQILPDALLQKTRRNSGSRSSQAGDEPALSLLLAARFLLCPSAYLCCQLTNQMNQHPQVSTHDTVPTTA